MMFSAGRPDVLPVGDLGVRKGFQILFSLKVSCRRLLLLSLLILDNCSDGKYTAAQVHPCALLHANIMHSMCAQELPDAAKMEALAASWRPWRSIGSWYMWRLTEAEGTKSPKKLKKVKNAEEEVVEPVSA